MKEVASLLIDAGMGAVALYTVRQLSTAVKALTSAVQELKSGHQNHEDRLRDLEKAA